LGVLDQNPREQALRLKANASLTTLLEKLSVIKLDEGKRVQCKSKT